MNITTVIHELFRKIDSQVDWSAYQSCNHTAKNGINCIKCASGQYYDGRSIDYSCDQLRKIYILRYVHVHLSEIYNAFQQLQGNNDLPEWQQTVSAISLGGGPGSDIAGFKRFVTEDGFYSSNVKNFEITRLDRVCEWDNLAEDVIHLFSKTDISFIHHKKTCDIKDATPTSSKYEIFILSYIISEVDELTLTRLIDFIKSTMRQRAIIIINDRNEQPVIDKIQILIDNFNIIHGNQNSHEKFCGILYPDDMIDKIKPKRNMKSIRASAIIEAPQ